MNHYVDVTLQSCSHSWPSQGMHTFLKTYIRTSLVPVWRRSDESFLLHMNYRHAYGTYIHRVYLRVHTYIQRLLLGFCIIVLLSCALWSYLISFLSVRWSKQRSRTKGATLNKENLQTVIRHDLTLYINIVAVRLLVWVEEVGMCVWLTAGNCSPSPHHT